MPDDSRIDFESLLPYPTEIDGSFQLDNGELVTCYRVLLSLHQFLSDAQELPIPSPNRLLCRVMQADLDRALLAVRTIHEMNMSAAPEGTEAEAASE
jgi:hypothetical protein